MLSTKGTWPRHTAHVQVNSSVVYLSCSARYTGYTSHITLIFFFSALSHFARKPRIMATRALPLIPAEASPWAVAAAAVAAALLWLAAWTLGWAWWTPRRLERVLRAQGLKGTRYRLFTGDITESAQLNREARAKPLPAGSHDIVRRVQPMLYDTVKQYGNTRCICKHRERIWYVCYLLRGHPCKD